MPLELGSPQNHRAEGAEGVATLVPLRLEPSLAVEVAVDELLANFVSADPGAEDA